MPYTRISKYERGELEPPLPVLLQYSHVAGVHMEDIVDDELDLPEKLPGNVRYPKASNASPHREKQPDESQGLRSKPTQSRREIALTSEPQDVTDAHVSRILPSGVLMKVFG